MFEKRNFKVGDKLVNSLHQTAVVVGMPGMCEYDQHNYGAAEYGMQIKKGNDEKAVWGFQEDWELYHEPKKTEETKSMFKKGDKVVLKAGCVSANGDWTTKDICVVMTVPRKEDYDGYSFTAAKEGFIIYNIKELCPRIDNSTTHWERQCNYELYKEPKPIKKEITNMFKVGDKVVCISNDIPAKVGDVATVCLLPVTHGWGMFVAMTGGTDQYMIQDHWKLYEEPAKEQLYKIVDVSSCSAHYDGRKQYMGQVGTFDDDTDTGQRPPEGFQSGWFRNEEHYDYFFAVKLEEYTPEPEKPAKVEFKKGDYVICKKSYWSYEEGDVAVVDSVPNADEIIVFGKYGGVFGEHLYIMPKSKFELYSQKEYKGSNVINSIETRRGTAWCTGNLYDTPCATYPKS